MFGSRHYQMHFQWTLRHLVHLGTTIRRGHFFFVLFLTSDFPSLGHQPSTDWCVAILQHYVRAVREAAHAWAGPHALTITIRQI